MLYLKNFMYLKCIIESTLYQLTKYDMVNPPYYKCKDCYFSSPDLFIIAKHRCEKHSKKKKQIVKHYIQ